MLLCLAVFKGVFISCLWCLLRFSRSAGPASWTSWQKITQGNEVSRLSLVCAYFKGSQQQKIQITLHLEWIQIHWFSKTSTCSAFLCNFKVFSSHASPELKNIALIKVPMHNSEYIWRKLFWCYSTAATEINVRYIFKQASLKCVCVCVWCVWKLLSP